MQQLSASAPLLVLVLLLSLVGFVASNARDHWIMGEGTIGHSLLDHQVLIVKEANVSRNCDAHKGKDLRFANFRYLVCAGVAINEMHVMTTSACMHQFFYGKHNIEADLGVVVMPLSASAQLIAAKEFYPHPEYTISPEEPGFPKHNIYVIELACKILPENYMEMDLAIETIGELCNNGECVTSAFNERRLAGVRMQEIAPRVKGHNSYNKPKPDHLPSHQDEDYRPNYEDEIDDFKLGRARRQVAPAAPAAAPAAAPSAAPAAPAAAAPADANAAAAAAQEQETNENEIGGENSTDLFCPLTGSPVMKGHTLVALVSDACNYIKPDVNWWYVNSADNLNFIYAFVSFRETPDEAEPYPPGDPDDPYAPLPDVDVEIPELLPEDGKNCNGAAGGAAGRPGGIGTDGGAGVSHTSNTNINNNFFFFGGDWRSLCNSTESMRCWANLKELFLPQGTGGAGGNVGGFVGDPCSAAAANRRRTGAQKAPPKAKSRSRRPPPGKARKKDPRKGMRILPRRASSIRDIRKITMRLLRPHIDKLSVFSERRGKSIGRSRTNGNPTRGSGGGAGKSERKMSSPRQQQRQEKEVTNNNKDKVKVTIDATFPQNGGKNEKLSSPDYFGMRKQPSGGGGGGGKSQRTMAGGGGGSPANTNLKEPLKNMNLKELFQDEKYKDIGIPDKYKSLYQQYMREKNQQN